MCVALEKSGNVNSFLNMHRVAIRMSSVCNEDRFGMYLVCIKLIQTEREVCFLFDGAATHLEHIWELI